MHILKLQSNRFLFHLRSTYDDDEEERQKDRNSLTADQLWTDEVSSKGFYSWRVELHWRIFFITFRQDFDGNKYYFKLIRRISAEHLHCLTYQNNERTEREREKQSMNEANEISMKIFVVFHPNHRNVSKVIDVDLVKLLSKS